MTDDDLVKRLDDINRNYDLARGVHSTIRDAKARIEALTAEREELVEYNEQFSVDNQFLKKRVEKAEADNARLREALRFYADASWSSLDDDLGNNGRPGVKARAALRGHDDD